VPVLGGLDDGAAQAFSIVAGMALLGTLVVTGAANCTTDSGETRGCAEPALPVTFLLLGAPSRGWADSSAATMCHGVH